jgi:hypothetical protein
LNGSLDFGPTAYSGLSAVGDIRAMTWTEGDRQWADCTLDELRVSSIAHSGDWITTQHNNQNDTSSFYSIGNEESLSTGIGSSYEWVELYNPWNNTVTLDGWYITDNDGNKFYLTGANYIPFDGYLVCHLAQSGTNSSTDVYGPIIASGSSPSTMLGDNDDLALFDSRGGMVDYLAWGGDAGSDDDEAVSWRQWTDGEYMDTSELLENETIGRDKDSTDTDMPSDWENSTTDKADPYGVNATNQTQGARNIDCIIPEFDLLAIPMLMIAVIFLSFKRYYYSISKSNCKSKNKRRDTQNNFKRSSKIH